MSLDASHDLAGLRHVLEWALLSAFVARSRVGASCYCCGYDGLAAIILREALWSETGYG